MKFTQVMTPAFHRTLCKLFIWLDSEVRGSTCVDPFQDGSRAQHTSKKLISANRRMCLNSVPYEKSWLGLPVIESGYYICSYNLLHVHSLEERQNLANYLVFWRDSKSPSSASHPPIKQKMPLVLMFHCVGMTKIWWLLKHKGFFVWFFFFSY